MKMKKRVVHSKDDAMRAVNDIREKYDVETFDDLCSLAYCVIDFLDAVEVLEELDMAQLVCINNLRGLLKIVHNNFYEFEHYLK